MCECAPIRSTLVRSRLSDSFSSAIFFFWIDRLRRLRRREEEEEIFEVLGFRRVAMQWRRDVDVILK